MHFWLRAAIRGLTSLLIIVTAFGQTTTGSITGTVTDPSGAVVPGAQVTVTNERDGGSREIATNNAGIFSVPDLTSGPYTVRVNASGFAQYEAPRLMLVSNQVLNLDVHMALAAAGTTVQVAEAATGISTETSNISNLKTSRDLQELPLV